MAQAKQRPSARAAPKGDGTAAVGGPGGTAAKAATHPTCTVSFCPICAVVTSVGDLRPELVEHLLAAGREFLLAVRSAIDARLDETESKPTRLERLTIE